MSHGDLDWMVRNGVEVVAGVNLLLANRRIDISNNCYVYPLKITKYTFTAKVVIFNPRNNREFRTILKDIETNPSYGIIKKCQCMRNIAESMLWGYGLDESENSDIRIL